MKNSKRLNILLEINSRALMYGVVFKIMFTYIFSRPVISLISDILLVIGGAVLIIIIYKMQQQDSVREYQCLCNYCDITECEKNPYGNQIQEEFKKVIAEWAEDHPVEAKNIPVIDNYGEIK
jgi:hypothetical protein